MVAQFIAISKLIFFQIFFPDQIKHTRQLALPIQTLIITNNINNFSQKVDQYLFLLNIKRLAKNSVLQSTNFITYITRGKI